MPQIPDFTDPRYLDEVGWFLYHEKYGRDKFGGSYDAERLAYSKLLLDEVLKYLDREVTWVTDKSVVSIGCGCTGDLTAFPAELKIAIDPLLYVYQKLDLLVPDAAGGRTVYLPVQAEDLPLLDDFADLVICRNALDHMPKPEAALGEIRRILNPDGVFFASVDIGGAPTPDEPTVFSVESLRAVLDTHFDIVTLANDYPPHSKHRECSARIVMRQKTRARQRLDKQALLRAYENRVEGEQSH